MKIQVLTDKNSWIAENFIGFVKSKLKKFSKNVEVANNHKFLKKNCDLNIILSYSKIIPKKYLNRSKFNLVVRVKFAQRKRNVTSQLADFTK